MVISGRVESVHRRSRFGMAGVNPSSISRAASLPGIRRQRPSFTLAMIRLAAQARTVTGFIRSRSAKSLTVISSLSLHVNFDGCTWISLRGILIQGYRLILSAQRPQ